MANVKDVLNALERNLAINNTGVYVYVNKQIIEQAIDILKSIKEPAKRTRKSTKTTD